MAHRCVSATKDGRQLVIDWPLRNVALGEVLGLMGYMKMRGRNAYFAEEFMTVVWLCVAKAMGREARTENLTRENAPSARRAEDERT